MTFCAVDICVAEKSGETLIIWTGDVERDAVATVADEERLTIALGVLR